MKGADEPVAAKLELGAASKLVADGSATTTSRRTARKTFDLHHGRKTARMPADAS